MIDYIDFIRYLEQQGYAFGTSPDSATQYLAHRTDDVPQRLYQRAQILDASQNIQSSLHLWQHKLAWGRKIVSLACLLFGWISTYALMQQAHLNFLWILFSVLGVHTLMLCLSLAGCFWGKMPLLPWQPMPRTPSSLHQYIAQYYWQQQQSPRYRWTLYATQHGWALCFLLGVWLAALMLLTVRQYTFNWQSTLWDAPTFAAVFGALAWLPAQLGLPTPQFHDIANAQNQHNIATATAWAQLFLSSIVLYGLLPRALAWAFCRWQQQRHQAVLNLHLPYYQHIIQQWQQRVTDSADDYRADTIAQTPRAHANALAADTQHWAILLDSPHAPTHWFGNTLAQTWQDYGSVAEREDFAQVQAALAQHNVQLLVGVRANSLPDRGNVRRLVTLAQHASAGIVLLLLFPEHSESSLHLETAQQWQLAAEQHGWLCLSTRPQSS